MSESVQTVVAAVAKAQATLAAYLEPGGPDPAETLVRLLSILDHEDVVRAVHAINPASRAT